MLKCGGSGGLAEKGNTAGDMIGLDRWISNRFSGSAGKVSGDGGGGTLDGTTAAAGTGIIRGGAGCVI